MSAVLVHESDLQTVQQMIVQAFRAGALEDGTPLADFPDMNYVREAEELIVSSHRLAGAIQQADRVLDRDAIARVAEDRGEVPFLEFGEPEVTDDVLRIALNVCLGFPDVEPLRLGAEVFAFRRETSGQWTTAEPPRALAY